MANTTMNITDIWKQVSNIGSTDFVNVADGTKRTVSWGHLEWLGFAGSILFMGVITSFLGVLAIRAGQKLF